jgi:molybdopterin synthase sulfur carrier subunit
MVLTVKLFAGFRSGRFAVAQIDRPSGATVGSIIDDLRIPRGQVGTLVVSGRQADLQYRPGPGETISIFPLAAR